MDVMDVIARFVRFVIWVLVLSWVFRLLGKAASWALRRAFQAGPQPDAAAGQETEGTSRGPQLAARHLVRDPVCGMHLAETLAIPFRDSGVLVHFCSAECRDKYASGILRRAANA
jgi:YHS domain-containing protein